MSDLITALWLILAALCVAMAMKKQAEKPATKHYVIHWEYPTVSGKVVYNIEGVLVDGQFSIETSDGHFIERREKSP